MTKLDAIAQIRMGANQHKIVEIARLAQQERSLSDQLTNLRWKLTNQQLLQIADNFSK